MSNMQLQVFINGEFVGMVFHPSEPEVGQTIEDPIITALLGDREVTNVSFVGNMVMITTEDIQ